MKLDVKACTIACAALAGIGLFALTWWVFLTGGAAGAADMEWISRVYLGYTVSPLGSVIGAFWAAVDGAFGGAIFAWLYNLLAARPS